MKAEATRDCACFKVRFHGAQVACVCACFCACYRFSSENQALLNKSDKNSQSAVFAVSTG